MKLISFLLICWLTSGFGSNLTAATFASEYELLRQFPTNILATLTGGEPDAQGFIGFHKRNSSWYEAGMQRGGCWMLIGAVVAGDVPRADAAWKSIETTFAHQLEDGGFRSVRKPGDTHEPTQPERVETAFFYLQELGHAILVVRASPLEPHFHERLIALEPRLRRACAFLQAGYDGIIPKAGHTANRLLIAAKAFGLCGVVLKDEGLKASSRKLVAAALQRRDTDGVFIERGGRDSSYNAVSLLMGQVLALHQPAPKLEEALERSMVWQRTRILPTGEVLLTGNTRTGLGQEKSFGGGIKKVNYGEVALALCYYGLKYDDPGLIALADKVRTWPSRASP
ncbi:MAG: hypothetical protein HY298_22450 [Verrucomicrobia bacterium]|nr:hypothetical protein [Verrucomicrobiota bacterium]